LNSFLFEGLVNQYKNILAVYFENKSADEISLLNDSRTEGMDCDM